MKINSYWQPKNEWTLPREIYRICINIIKSYNYFQKIIIDVSESKKSLKPELSAVNKVTAEYYINAIEDAFEEMVPNEARTAIWLNVTKDIPMQILPLYANYSIRQLERIKQKFVWGVCENLGLDFKGLGNFKILDEVLEIERSIEND